MVATVVINNLVVVDNWLSQCYLGDEFDSVEVLASLLDTGEYVHDCTFIGMCINFTIQYETTHRTLTMEVNPTYEIVGIEFGEREEGGSYYNSLYYRFSRHF
jgi:hypothetical protein